MLYPVELRGQAIFSREQQSIRASVPIATAPDQGHERGPAFFFEDNVCLIDQIGWGQT